MSGGGGTVEAVTSCFIIDMAQLRFLRGRGRISVLAGNGELVASCPDTEELDDREAALRGMDALLDGVVLTRVDSEGGSVEAEVVLYNPYTYETARGALPGTEVYADGSPLVLPAGGQLGVVADGVLTVGARHLALRAPEWGAVLRAQAAHQS